MGISKEELVQKIEAARKKLNRSIENGEGTKLYISTVLNWII